MKAVPLILLIVLQVMSLNVYADDAIKAKACDNALNACIDLTKQQDLNITYCKQEITALENEAVEQDNATTRHTVLYTVLGVATGALIVRAFR